MALGALKSLMCLEKRQQAGSSGCRKSPIQPTICAQPEATLLSCRPRVGRKRPVFARCLGSAMSRHMGFLRTWEDVRWVETRAAGRHGLRRRSHAPARRQCVVPMARRSRIWAQREGQTGGGSRAGRARRQWRRGHGAAQSLAAARRDGRCRSTRWTAGIRPVGRRSGGGPGHVAERELAR
jgi:hypothetical protein